MSMVTALQNLSREELEDIIMITYSEDNDRDNGTGLNLDCSMFIQSTNANNDLFYLDMVYFVSYRQFISFPG